VGYSNSGTISNCSNSGLVFSYSYRNAGTSPYTSSRAGGIVGYGSSAISSCYNSGSVSSESRGSSTYTADCWAGGIAGQNEQTISNCYNTNDVSALGHGSASSAYSGGIAGSNSGTLSNCYNAGAISVSTTLATLYSGSIVAYNTGSISSCFWNNEISGNSIGSSDGSGDFKGLTTEEMMNESSFSEWDISNNNTNSIWGIIDGFTYPTLNGVTNNAPFAIPDFIQATSSIAISVTLNSLYSNDYDYETNTANLVYELIDTTNHYGSLNNSIYSFYAEEEGDADTITYRVGEKLSTGDTLWGNNEMAIIYLSYYANGDGTKDNPYQITTIEELNSVRQGINKYYILMNDLDFVGSAYCSDSSDTGWEPIGSETDPFAGNFNGNGHVIRNLYINRSSTDYIGLFGYANNAIINSLGIQNGMVAGDAYSGMLIGYNTYSLVNNCYATGEVTGSQSVGGLVGYNCSSIKQCYAVVDVSSSSYPVGGFLGYNDDNDDSIQNCYATGNVSSTASSKVGGFAGYNYSSAINNCYSTGRVSGRGTSGGFVGDNKYSTLTDCYFNNVTSNQSSGIGANTNNQTVNALGTDWMRIAGNFENWDFASIWSIKNDTTSYPVLKSAVNNAPFAFADSIKSFSMVMNIDTILTNDYDYETGQDNLCYKIVSYSSNHSTVNKNNSTITFSTEGADAVVYCVGEIISAGDTLWGNQTTATFKITLYEFGAGTENDPYQIYTIDELNFMRQKLDKHFILMNNLDFNGSVYCSDSSLTGWEPVGDEPDPFTGNFNGQGNLIKNMFINRSSSSNTGLFGYTNNAVINNLGMVNSEITGKDYIGNLIGVANDSTLIGNCYATGAIAGEDYIGGIVGELFNSGISNCYSLVIVEGRYCVGGFIGYSYSSNINNCYTATTANNEIYNGGFIGYAKYCSITDCYYNTHTAYTGIGDYKDNEPQTLTGLTSAEMQQAVNFSSWNISTSNSDSIWGITEEKSYPVLSGITNNAPFTVPETFTPGISTPVEVTLDYLKANDYDYETGTANLVWEFLSITTHYGSLSNDTYTFNAEAKGAADTITYRTGEVISSGDTLWGNTVLTLFSVPYFEGSGTQEDPYKIASLNDLKTISEHDEMWNYYFIQTADIDAAETSNWNSGEGFSPIGYYYSNNNFAYFTGSYNGGNHSIRNLYINSSGDNCIGLFGYVGNESSIDNLRLTNCNITGYEKVGGLVGHGYNCSITNCTVITDNIRGYNSAGGIIGDSDNCTVSNCSVLGNVSGNCDNIGGLIGNSENSNILNCYVSGDVSSDNDVESFYENASNVGGLIGNSISSNISNCYVLGSVVAEANVWGGWTIYAYYSGGLIGKSSSSLISDCYTMVEVSGHKSPGAFIGYNASSYISNCYYNTEMASGLAAIGTNDNNQIVEALPADSMLMVESFINWDISNSGTSSIWGIIEGHTYPALNTVNNAPFAFDDDTFLLESMTDFSDSVLINDYDYENRQNNLIVDIVDKSYSGTETVVYYYRTGEVLSNNDTLWGYPATATVNIKLLDGSGTSGDPFVIATLGDLKILSEYENYWSAYIIQTADIDATDTKNWNNNAGFSPIGYYDDDLDNSIYFTGSYNGKGHIIKNLYAITPDSDDVGLFGVLGYGGNIDSLKLINCKITGNSNVGGLIGIVNEASSISNCMVTGTITGSDYCAGGLIGELYSGSVSNCYFSGTVIGEDYVGGLVGSNDYGNISKCYASGVVKGEEYIGGFTGFGYDAESSNCYTSADVSGNEYTGGFCGYGEYDEITNCYTIGNARGDSITGAFLGYNYLSSSTITNCYYNRDIADSTDAYATGLPTGSMLMTESFGNWDISNSNTNCIWGIIEGQTYPALNGVNNAPFAFADSIKTIETVLTSDTILDNDYDYEIGNIALVYVIDSIKLGTYNSGNFTLIDEETTLVYYRAGEVLSSGDTLLGNSATAFLINVEGCIWNGTGTWDETAYWSTGAMPETNDFVYVESGTLTLNQDAEVEELTIEVGAVLRIAPDQTLTVSDSLINNAAISGLVLQSDENGTAQLLNSTPDVPATVERYITGNAWHLVSSPAPGQTISDFLSTNTNVPANGIYRGMMDYDETNNNWNSFFTNTQSGNLTTGKGFSLRADADGVVTFTGTLASGTVSPAVARTGNYGWNCVGNPYPSAIFINENADATNNFITVNTDKLDSSYAVIYVWEDGSDAYTIVGQGEPAFYAQSGQAFMVKVNTGVTSLNFTQTMQTAQSSLTIKSGNFAWSGIELTALQDGKSRSAKIRFSNEMTTGLDVGYDAGVFKTGFDIYTKLVEDNGVDFGLQSLPETGIEQYQIPVGIDASASGEITFSLKSENLSPGIVPVLNDKLTGTSFSFENESDVYTTFVTDAAKGYGRFSLTFSSTTGINETGIPNFKAWYSEGYIYISGQMEGLGEATVYDINGRKVAIHQLSYSTQNRIEVPAGTNGIYLVKIKDSKRSEVLKVPVTGR